jgi:hypothetical protein
MGRPRTRAMDMRVLCDLWHDQAFCALTQSAQAMVFRSIGYMGRDASVGGRRYHSSDLSLDPWEFAALAPELIELGVWVLVDDQMVEVWPYKNLIEPMLVHRPRIDLSLRNFILDRDGHRCRYCGSTERLEMDHIMPWSAGGKDTVDNLQTLCRGCNQAKGAKVL